MQQSSSPAPVFAFFLLAFEVGNMLLVEAQRLDGNYLVLILTLIIACLQGAITEASTSNSGEIKNRLEALLPKLNVREKKEMKYLLLIASEEGK